ncbi:hypothetical protein KCV00_g385, partial [Aureobasidium melanogenum]
MSDEVTDQTFFAATIGIDLEAAMLLGQLQAFSLAEHGALVTDLERSIVDLASRRITVEHSSVLSDLLAKACRGPTRARVRGGLNDEKGGKIPGDGGALRRDEILIISRAMWELVCEGVGSGSSSSIECPDKEAMGGEYMRVLDALPSLREACSMYQRQAPGTMRNKQQQAFIQVGLHLICRASVDCVQVGCMSQRLRMTRQRRFLFPALRRALFVHRLLPERMMPGGVKGGSKRNRVYKALLLRGRDHFESEGDHLRICDCLPTQIMMYAINQRSRAEQYTTIQMIWTLQEGRRALNMSFLRRYYKPVKRSPLSACGSCDGFGLYNGGTNAALTESTQSLSVKNRSYPAVSLLVRECLSMKQDFTIKPPNHPPCITLGTEGPQRPALSRVPRVWKRTCRFSPFPLQSDHSILSAIYSSLPSHVGLASRASDDGVDRFALHNDREMLRDLSKTCEVDCVCANAKAFSGQPNNASTTLHFDIHDHLPTDWGDSSPYHPVSRPLVRMQQMPLQQLDTWLCCKQRQSRAGLCLGRSWTHHKDVLHGRWRVLRLRDAYMLEREDVGFLDSHRWGD